MKNFLRDAPAVVVALLLLLVAGVVPVWAYNSKPVGVAYSDPLLTSPGVSGTMTVTGTQNITGTFKLGGTSVTSSAAELNLLHGFSALATKSVSILGGTTVLAGAASVATYSVSSVPAASLVFWVQTTAVSTAASRSCVISNVRASGANEIEVTTVNASNSNLVSSAASLSLMVLQ